MKNGFTSKELLITLIIIFSISGITYYLYAQAAAKTNKQELINQAKLHIEELNSKIIDAKNNNKTTLFQTYIPKKENQTSTFYIENMNLNKNGKFKGIIKVTFIDNKYKYKIAIEDGTYMLGTKNNPIEKENITVEKITTYTKAIFEN